MHCLGIFCWLILCLFPCCLQAQDIFQCPLCGEGTELTNSAGVVTLPQMGDIPCSQLQQLADQGAINSQDCVLLEPFVRAPCGCREIAAVNSTVGPTDQPTQAPTFGPAPDCYEDLNMITARENALSVEELNIGRTYILCPRTVFFMGRLNQGFGFDGGFDNITPRPNVHYQCGRSGSSANSCRLLDGTYPILSFNGDPEQYNITFQGLTFESAASGAVLAAMPGDLTFIDCIFRNHENTGPIHILFDSSSPRRLREYNGFYEEIRSSASAAAEDADMNAAGGSKILDIFGNEYFHRALQGSETRSTLTLTFRQCLFERNKLISQGAIAGMITSVTAATTLVFEDVMFRNNDYGDITLKSSTAAIISRGPLTLKNVCFYGNSFIRDSPVISIGGQSVDVSGNYVDNEDEGLSCSLIARFADESAWESGDTFVCIKPDSRTCRSTVPLVPLRAPVTEPTRMPVPQLTLPPTTRSPAIQDSGTDSRVGASSLPFVGVSTAIAMMFVLMDLLAAL